MAARTEGKLEEFAEDLGKLLGQAQNKAENWLGLRKAIAANLIGLRDTATRLLAQLGVSDGASPARKQTSTSSAPARRGPGRPKGTAKKKRTMSAEARAKIAAAQRARWAKQKAQK